MPLQAEELVKRIKDDKVSTGIMHGGAAITYIDY